MTSMARLIYNTSITDKYGCHYHSYICRLHRLKWDSNVISFISSHWYAQILPKFVSCLPLYKGKISTQEWFSFLNYGLLLVKFAVYALRTFSHSIHFFFILVWSDCFRVMVLVVSKRNNEKINLSPPGKPELEYIITSATLYGFITGIILQIVLFILLEQILCTHWVTFFQ